MSKKNTERGDVRETWEAWPKNSPTLLISVSGKPRSASEAAIAAAEIFDRRIELTNNGLPPATRSIVVRRDDASVYVIELKKMVKVFWDLRSQTLDSQRRVKE